MRAAPRFARAATPGAVVPETGTSARGRRVPGRSAESRSGFAAEKRAAYSARNASIGAMRVARRAGSHVASKPTAPSTSESEKYVGGSRGLTP